MLNQPQLQLQPDFLALQGIDTDQFEIYSKNTTENYISKGQKRKDRRQKLRKRLHDPDLRKQGKKEQKANERAKIGKIIDKMPKQQAHNYLKAIQSKKIQAMQKIKAAMATGQKIIIDMVYEERMNDKQNKSLGKQMTLIQRAIKLFQKPPSIHVCNLTGKTKAIFQKMAYEHMALTAHEEDLSQCMKTLNGKLIYLSPDAEQSLQTIEEDQVFILGGLIDRTIIKYASLQRAKKLGIQARKLPIRQYMKGRSCLNLDHVVAMLCKFKQTQSWKVAFDYAAPKRWKKDEEKGQKREPQQKEEKYQKEEEQQSEERQLKEEVESMQSNKVKSQTQHIEQPEESTQKILQDKDNIDHNN